jgi:hypothetical protein
MVSTSSGLLGGVHSDEKSSKRPTPVALDNVYVGSHNRLQMERETPTPSGVDDRLSDNANRSPTSDDQVRFVRDGVNDRGLSDDHVDWNQTRETREMYRSAYGIPTEILDLSVDDFTSRRLARSVFASVVRIRFDSPDTVLHPNTLAMITEHLAGRVPRARVEGEYLIVSFRVEDESHESCMRAADFGFTLALLLNGLPRVRLGVDANLISRSTTPKGQLPD